MRPVLNSVIVTIFTLLSLSLTISSVTTADTALYLTPYIKKNQTAEARNLSLVNPELFLGRKSWSGFLTVNETFNSNIFFWFLPAANKQPLEETPWILWLQGDPGTSSFYGLVEEFGPFYWNSTTKQLQHRKINWNDEFSLLIIDNPVGTGFSFTNNNLGLPLNINQTTDYLLNAVQQFLQVFPELRKAPLYIAGDSYAGHYVPALGYEMMQSKTDVNLQGLMMGNPITDRMATANISAMYYQWGLIDAQGVLAVSSMQDQYIQALRNGDLSFADQLRVKLYETLNKISALKNSFNVLNEDRPGAKFQDMFFTKEIKDALHVGDINFTLVNKTSLKSDLLKSSQYHIEILLNNNYRVLIYCGQLDIVAPCTQNSLDRLTQWHWRGRHEFILSPRLLWQEPLGPNIGYIKSGGGFTEVLILGAGHIVPYDKPQEAKELITAFIRKQKLNTPSNYQPSIEDTPDFDVYLNSLSTPSPSPIIDSQTNTQAGIIVSIVLNILLFFTIITMIMYFIRWKKRREGFFYTADDTSSISDGILTMS